MSHLILIENFYLTTQEYNQLDRFARLVNRTKQDVLRELINGLPEVAIEDDWFTDTKRLQKHNL